MTLLLRKQLLWTGAVLLAGGATYVAGPGRSAAPAPAAAAARTQRPAAAQPEGPVADIRLEALGQTGGEVARATRNPFRFQARPQPDAARRAGRQEFAPPPAPTGPPPLPPIPLRFIGLIDAPPRVGRVALLSDGRGGLMYGREGDTIEGRYRMLRVGTDSVELSYADGRGRQTIRLSGQ